MGDKQTEEVVPDSILTALVAIHTTLKSNLDYMGSIDTALWSLHDELARIKKTLDLLAVSYTHLRAHET